MRQVEIELNWEPAEKFDRRRLIPGPFKVKADDLVVRVDVSQLLQHGRQPVHRHPLLCEAIGFENFKDAAGVDGPYRNINECPLDIGESDPNGIGRVISDLLLDDSKLAGVHTVDEANSDITILDNVLRDPRGSAESGIYPALLKLRVLRMRGLLVIEVNCLRHLLGQSMHSHRGVMGKVGLPFYGDKDLEDVNISPYIAMLFPVREGEIEAFESCVVRQELYKGLGCRILCEAPILPLLPENGCDIGQFEDLLWKLIKIPGYVCFSDLDSCLVHGRSS